MDTGCPALTEMTPKASRPYMPDYGIQPADKGAGLLPWSFVGEHMSAARNYWAVSSSPENKPHAAPVWGLWHEETFYFSSGSTSRKARNWAANPAAVVHSESGDDAIMLEGEVEIVDEEKEKALLKTLDKAYQGKYHVGFLGLGNIYRLKIQRAFAWREADFTQSATRWIFE